jgi:acyl transferase domain-containing protein
MLGCSALLARECDTVIAGGGSILNEPYTFAGLSKGGFVSKTGNCRTFQDTADGYCRGEGVSVVVLKRLEDAVANNDRILAVISAAARNHSALASSITHPHSGTQQKLMNRVIQQANMTADQVNFVEMHGTATQAGDVAEMDSVMNTVGKQRTGSNPLFLGAVKANIGHGEAVSIPHRLILQR